MADAPAGGPPAKPSLAGLPKRPMPPQAPKAFVPGAAKAGMPGMSGAPAKPGMPVAPKPGSLLGGSHALPKGFFAAKGVAGASGALGAMKAPGVNLAALKAAAGKSGGAGGLLAKFAVPGAAKSGGLPGAAARRSVANFPNVRKAGAGGAGGYFVEKQALVIDFGHSLTKVGFAGEHRPRAFIPNPELVQRRRVSASLVSTASKNEWIEVLDGFLNVIFFHYLGVSPKDRRVIVCDSMASAASFREALAFVCFKRFASTALSLPLGLSMPLYLTGLSSGIVVDCGFDCARIFVTCAGVPIVSSYATARCGGRHLTVLLRKALREESFPEELLADDEAMEELKAQACYARCDIPAAPGRGAVKLQSEVVATFREASVPAKCRWEPLECLFSASSTAAETLLTEAASDDDALAERAEYRSIPEAFVETLQRLDADARALVVQNIVICGGVAMLPGVLLRLPVEIRDTLLAHDSTSLKFLASKLRFTPLDFPSVAAVWTGAAVHAMLEGLPEYTANEFNHGAPLPDWATDGYV
eukprot:TRINITY_DN55228_c0_g1_i1.p1 TRINITY_DN55228_c0_g1~~TRINITY_DN55228_c0_g1_i1.p1  ORF type:complete len:556 (+),score=139.01 TRINITY_DN55228_c0_g1_i1:79-1668(+)